MQLPAMTQQCSVFFQMHIVTYKLIYNSVKNAMMYSDGLAVLGVFFEVGFKGHFWLNILLTLFGFIPGIIHAFYVILKH